MIKCLAGYLQALVDEVVKYMDESDPGWRDGVDPKVVTEEVSSGWK